MSQFPKNVVLTPGPSEVDALLSSLCIDLGFCLPPAARTQLRENPPADVLGFVNAVFAAEGLNSATEGRRLYRQVRDYVAAVYQRAQMQSELTIKS